MIKLGELAEGGGTGIDLEWIVSRAPFLLRLKMVAGNAGPDTAALLDGCIRGGEVEEPADRRLALARRTLLGIRELAPLFT